MIRFHKAPKFRVEFLDEEGELVVENHENYKAACASAIKASRINYSAYLQAFTGSKMIGEVPYYEGVRSRCEV